MRRITSLSLICLGVFSTVSSFVLHSTGSLGSYGSIGEPTWRSWRPINYKYGQIPTYYPRQHAIRRRYRQPQQSYYHSGSRFIGSQSYGMRPQFGRTLYGQYRPRTRFSRYGPSMFRRSSFPSLGIHHRQGLSVRGRRTFMTRPVLSEFVGRSISSQRTRQRLSKTYGRRGTTRRQIRQQRRTTSVSSPRRLRQRQPNQEEVIAIFAVDEHDRRSDDSNKRTIAAPVAAAVTEQKVVKQPIAKSNLDIVASDADSVNIIVDANVKPAGVQRNINGKKMKAARSLIQSAKALPVASGASSVIGNKVIRTKGRGQTGSILSSLPVTSKMISTLDKGKVKKSNVGKTLHGSVSSGIKTKTAHILDSSKGALAAVGDKIASVTEELLTESSSLADIKGSAEPIADLVKDALHAVGSAAVKSGLDVSDLKNVAAVETSAKVKSKIGVAVKDADNVNIALNANVKSAADTKGAAGVTKKEVVGKIAKVKADIKTVIKDADNVNIVVDAKVKPAKDVAKVSKATVADKSAISVVDAKPVQSGAIVKDTVITDVITDVTKVIQDVHSSVHTTADKVVETIPVATLDKVIHPVEHVVHPVKHVIEPVKHVAHSDKHAVLPIHPIVKH